MKSEHRAGNDDALEMGATSDSWPGKEFDVATCRLTIDAGEAYAPLEVTCRWPKGETPKAYVVFCHGLGASGDDDAGLSTFLAAHGYLMIHPTFPDWIGAVAAAEPELGYAPQDRDLLRWTTVPPLHARLYEMLHTPFYWLERIRIIRAVMDNLDAIKASSCGRWAQPIPGAIAGHSFGAYTSQLFAGVEIDVPGEGASMFRDVRFQAAVLLSAQGRDQQGLREGSWDGMTGPVLTVTGTLDGGAKGQDWHWKVEPFELAPTGAKYLAVFDDADHYLGGMTENDPTPHRPDQQQAVSWLTLAFLDAHVMNERVAYARLTSIDNRIGACTVEFRRK